jgi:hypothetical protein
MVEELDAAAEGPAGPHADELMLFGQFVGLWDVDVRYYPEDGTTNAHRGEWSWGWILGGRAIQDVYTVPPRTEQEREGIEPLVHGTTVRIYDPSLDAWHIVWASPLAGVALNFVARKRGDEIVLEGSTDDGSLLHWIFSDIGPSSYRWRAVSSSDGGGSWRTRQEMAVRRR